MDFFSEFQRLKIKLEDVKLATENFAENKVIGIGGFGKVYKGEIFHSKGKSMVAFKRLDSRNGQGNPEFWKEIMMLSRYKHENLVSLLRYCDDGGEKILVYEHASRGSLDRHLSFTALTWIQCLKICLGVARGLSFLHDPMGTQQRVIHRDIKSSNILLDDNWNAKVSDFGLSKIGPANQQHTIVVSNVVGTLGYLDPLYLEKGVLTKESDVYSFGVVLFEALCGRLCFEYNNGQCQILVRSWKESYIHKKLDEIILQDMRQQMNLSSLETFSDIAYLCLQESREERPPMAHVVEKLEIALQFQEIFDLMEVPKEYKEIFKSAFTPMIFRSEEELKRLLSKGIIINGGKTWFSLNKNGEHCELICARGCLNPSANEYRSEENSRFVEGCYRVNEVRFGVHASARFLSPGITYTVNLVFKYFSPLEYPSKAAPLDLKYQLRGETRYSFPYLAYERENGWMMIELFHFISEGTNFDLDIRFESTKYKPTSLDLIVEGIEFRPLSKVEHEALEDVEEDIQPTSDSDIDWEQKLPNDYKEIIKWSKDSIEWTTKKELYYIFRKGFLVDNWISFLFNNGEEWFSLDKNGKKCPMLPARVALVKSEWIWMPLSTSRFRELAFNSRFLRFDIICKIKSQIFPRTRVINPKDGQDTYNPSDMPKFFKGLPQLRDDGWMEVQVWEFQTSTTSETIPINFNFNSANYNPMRLLMDL